MKVTNISFANGIPEIKVEGKGITIDIGTVSLQMTFDEWRVLYLHISLAWERAKRPATLPAGKEKT